MSGEIQIEDFGEMQGLITQLQILRGQSTNLCFYVDEWVCNKEGFTPSDACVLQQLADALPTISTFFWNASSVFSATMGDLIEAVAATMQDYQTQEGEVVTSMDVLLNRVSIEDQVASQGNHNIPVGS